MDNRTGLIERAAALLREGARDADKREVRDPVKDALIPTNQDRPEAAVLASPSPPLARSVVLDRGYLAQIGIVMPWTTSARVVEEFRIVKRNVMFPWQLPEYPKAGARPPRVVMVTSSRPREGKTFCSINLALAFAAEESLVTVLIDADSVRGDAARLLKLPPSPGLTDVLAGTCGLDDALIQTDLPNLVTLPPGTHNPQVPEMLAGRGLSSLVADIARRYPEHVIVMDTAPCLASTDPTAIAAVAGQVVFVIEAEHTQQSEIESSINLLSGCQEIKFLLNKAPRGSSEHFGSYSYYYTPGGTASKASDD
jgi:capsular exopolysaccharide synthesis family protein